MQLLSNSTNRLRRGWWPVLALLLAANTVAQVYKYQDENGKWHFTDKEPQQGQQTEVLDIGGAQKPAAGGDLLEQLTRDFTPAGPIEQSTLAVVKVVTLAGSGSGFFVSTDGYIVTNKHVVRPQENSRWRDMDEKLEDMEERFSRNKKNLDWEKKNIAKYERDLERFKDSIAEAPVGLRPQKWEEYKDHQQRLADRKRRYREALGQHREQYSEYKKRASDHRWRSANANTAQRFTIQLKDQTELNVTLVRLSEKHDLALLKLDGYVTPTLEINADKRAAQGDTVFAMGSPLGMSDYVTSGIITRVGRDSIVTDAKILPGNSGGPLVTSAGEVLGVNTQKFSPSGNIMADGFGIAIPVDVVREEFSAIIGEPAEPPAEP